MSRRKHLPSAALDCSRFTTNPTRPATCGLRLNGPSACAVLKIRRGRGGSFNGAATITTVTLSRTLTSFMALASAPGRIDASPWQRGPLKVSQQPEPGPDLCVFSACYSRFILTIKKNNNLQNALRGVSGLKARRCQKRLKIMLIW